MLRMRGFVFGVLCLVFVLGCVWVCVAAEGNPDVLVFYREGCNDCRHMDDLLEDLQELYPGIIVAHIEEQEPGASDLMWSLSTKYGIFPSKFPVIFVGDLGIVGIGRDKELLLRQTVRDCVFNGCDSPIEVLEEEPLSIVTLASILIGVLLLAIWLL